VARLEIEEQFYFSRSSGEVGNFETGDFFLGLVLAERIPFITFIVIRVVAAGARTIIYKLHLVSHFGWHVHFQLGTVLYNAIYIKLVRGMYILLELEISFHMLGIRVDIVCTVSIIGGWTSSGYPLLM